MEAFATQVELRPLMELLEGIDAGRIALPDFQRDFIWSEANVRSLLVTVFRRWPAGSLLLIGHTPDGFRLKTFDGGPQDLKHDEVELVVLDGQQRLTALYQALYDRGDYVYAIDLERMEDETEEDIEAAIVSFRRSVWDKKYRQPSLVRERSLIPIYELRSSFEYFPWLESITSVAASTDKKRLESRLTELFQHFLGGSERYEFPCVTLNPRTDPAAIARVFESVNRTGVKLGAFDLVVARSYGRDWNLREEWERARTESHLLERFFGDDGLPILQVVALLEQRNIRQSAVINLPAGTVRQMWSPTVDAVNRALEFLVSQCGVVRPEWLPYDGMVLPLAAVAFEFDLLENRELLVQWFFSRSFALAFEVAANTALVADFLTLRESLAQGGLPEPMAVSAATLIDATRQRPSALWRTFLTALSFNDAHDITGQDLGLQEARNSLTPPSDDVVVASIYSHRSVFNDEKLDRRVLSGLLATRGIAERLRQGEPLQMVVTSFERADPAAVDAALASQFLPPMRQLEHLHLAPRELFVARAELVAQFMSQLTGQRLRWDVDE